MNNNIEKVRAEIKRRIEQFKEERNKIPSEMSKSFDIISLGARIAALEEILVFINSILAEQPSEEFKEEFDNYCVHGDIRNPNFDGPFGYDDIRKTAIHFANWQKEQIINKAYDWLKDNFYQYGEDGKDNNGCSILYDFKKAMEDK